MKKILVFGAGMVSAPVVHYLIKQGYEMTLVDKEIQKASSLIAGFDHAVSKYCDCDQDTSTMRTLISQSDIVVSLLPALKHPLVGQMCAEEGKHLVTTSYVSPGMKNLDEIAKAQGLIFLNEMGLDPGLDHMSAMSIIREKESQGAELKSFISWCGGLPSPEANDNPFGYKFSWSPAGVLRAAKNSARYLKNGTIVEIPNQALFKNPEHIEIKGLGEFEVYPNRDSLSYSSLYGFSDKVHTLLRATLRNKGYCLLFEYLVQLGLLSEEPVYDIAGMSYFECMKKIIGQDPKNAISSQLPPEVRDKVLAGLEYIHLFSTEVIDLERGSLFDVVCTAMTKHLVYTKDQNDMVIMRHAMDFAYPDNRQETIYSTLTCYGIKNGYSAMARTVGLPAAIGVTLIAEKKIPQTGVIIPVVPSLYKPILSKLEKEGIVFISDSECS